MTVSRRLERARAFMVAERTGRIVCDIAAGALILAAFIVAVEAVRNIPGPYDFDHWRDLAQAQTVRDGHWLADSYYRGELAWYNPLLAWIVALGSLLSGASVTAFHVQAGPYLNLLGPVTFYVLTRRVAGAAAALAALTLYLFFVCGNEPSWAYPTYSPWLFAANLGQGFFFTAMLALLHAKQGTSFVRDAVAGVLIGLTFLCHTAPAVLLAGVASIIFLTAPKRLVTIAAISFIVASPFLYSIGWHYRFRVVNHAPVVWAYTPITATRLFQTICENGLLFVGGIVGLGVIRRPLVIGLWLVLAFVLMLYNVMPLPRFVPAFHFWLYSIAALTLLAGATLAWLCPRPVPLVATVLVMTIGHWSVYTTRFDLDGARRHALARDPNFNLAARFLHRTLSRDGVVLGTYGSTLLIIGPSGRKSIAPDPVYANPYVPSDARVADREAMLAAIQMGDATTLSRLARTYDVSVVVSVGKKECAAAAAMLRLEWRFGDVCISRMTY